MTIIAQKNELQKMLFFPFNVKIKLFHTKIMLNKIFSLKKIRAFLEDLLLKINQNFGIILVVIFLFTWLSILLSRGTDLTTADLGRHIANGRYFFENHKIPEKNLYSYSNPDAPFVNHHWGSGVIFYLIWKYFDFSGLTSFYIAISLLTFFLIFSLTKKFSCLAIATFVATLAIPLIGDRTEIRPEIFSYFFSVVFFQLLWKYKYENMSSRWLLLLPAIMLIWVNLHIYFIFGIGILGLFFLDMLLEKNKKKSKALGIILALIMLATLFNPLGIKGALYPFNIFQNYDYRVLENQSVGFLSNLTFVANPNLLIFKITLSILLLSHLALLIFNRKKISWPLFGLAITISVLGWSALRNFALFGYFSIPTIAYGITGVMKKSYLKKYQAFFFIPSFFAFIFFANRDAIYSDKSTEYIPKEVSASANFFINNHLSGPIFNDYDIGSFLIFKLFPREKVFVDNRPEAYPKDFFQTVYIPMQQSDTAWNDALVKYNFNTIYFSLKDATPWGQNFLLKRIDDSNWSPVYADQYAIIFLRKNEKNKDLISKFKIARDNFSFSKFQ